MASMADMATSTEYQAEFAPDWSSPPGDTIRDIMAERGISMDDFAGMMDMPSGDAIDLVDGKKRITIAMARQLVKVLGSSIEFWMTRDYQYMVQEREIQDQANGNSPAAAPIYDDGQCILYHGNCVDILPQLPEKANLMVTSPPYDDLREYGGISFDFDRVANAIIDALAPNGVLVWVVGDATIDGDETGTSFRHALGFKDRGLKLHDTMIYQKIIPGNPTNNRYYQTFEYMFVFCKGKPAVFNPIRDRKNANAGISHSPTRVLGRTKDKLSNPTRPVIEIPEYGKRWNVWVYEVGFAKSAPDMPAAHKHPAIFPPALAIDHIKSWSNPGDLVVDPMAGSGTTLRAAKMLNRRSIGIEINEEYCDIIRNRVAQGAFQLDIDDELVPDDE